MTKTSIAPVFAVRVEEAYGVVQLVAHVRFVDKDGELSSPRWGAYTLPDKVTALTEFSVRAYVSRDMGVFGMRYGFYGIDLVSAAQATSIARVIRKVDTGLYRLNEEEGYVADGDFAQYMIRVAKVLGIRTYYAHNTKEQYDMCGSWFSHVGAPSLQYRIEQWAKEYGKPATVDA